MSWLRYCLTSAAAKSLQSCLSLCDPIDSSSPGSAVHGILQARTLEWVAISFSNAWKWKVKVKSLSPVWLSDPMDCRLPCSSVHGSFQTRVLEWIVIAFSLLPLQLSKLNIPVSLLCAQLLFCVQPFMALWTVAHQGPLSLGFFRQEYWSGLPFPSPRDLCDRPRDQIFVFCVSCICRQIFTAEPSGLTGPVRLIVLHFLYFNLYRILR